MNTKAKGKLGESEAARYLESKGYRIVERNYRTPRCEIDIVAEKESVLVIVEVKSWSSLDEEQLEFSIDGRKRRSISHGARVFLKSNPGYAEYRVRFDVILHRPQSGIVRHVQDAFSESN